MYIGIIVQWSYLAQKRSSYFLQISKSPSWTNILFRFRKSVGSSKTPRSFRLAIGHVASFSASVRPGGCLALAFTFSHFQVSSSGTHTSTYHQPMDHLSTNSVFPTVIQLVAANQQMWTNYKLLQQYGDIATKSRIRIHSLPCPINLFSLLNIVICSIL